jgi:hypothetical protein
VAWLESLGAGASVDELALEFDDGVRLAPQFVEASWLPASVLEPLRALGDLPPLHEWPTASIVVARSCPRVVIELVRGSATGKTVLHLIS